LILKRKAVKSRAIVLTFDDGPSDRLTPAIMEMLDENKIKATFFLLGRNIAGRERIVKQIADRGHEICSHGYDHLRYWKVHPFRALADIKHGWRAIDSALGQERKKYPFRPPYGKLNIVCLLYLWFLRIPIIYWTVDTGDTSLVDKRDKQRATITAGKTGGAVILAHDFERSGNAEGDFTLSSIKLVLEEVEKTDLSTITVSELLQIGG